MENRTVASTLNNIQQGTTLHVFDMDGNCHAVEPTVAYFMLSRYTRTGNIPLSPKVTQTLISLCTNNMNQFYATFPFGDVNVQEDWLPGWLNQILGQIHVQTPRAIQDRNREFIRNLVDRDFCSLYRAARILRIHGNFVEMVFKERMEYMMRKPVNPSEEFYIEGDDRDFHYLHNAYTEVRDMDGNRYQVESTVAYFMLSRSYYKCGWLPISPKVTKNLIRLCTDNIQKFHAMFPRMGGSVEGWLQRLLAQICVITPRSIQDLNRDFIRSLDDQEFCGLYRGARILNIYEFFQEIVFNERLEHMKAKSVFPPGEFSIKSNGRDFHYIYNEYTDP